MKKTANSILVSEPLQIWLIQKCLIGTKVLQGGAYYGYLDDNDNARGWGVLTFGICVIKSTFINDT